MIAASPPRCPTKADFRDALVVNGVLLGLSAINLDYGESFRLMAAGVGGVAAAWMMVALRPREESLPIRLLLTYGAIPGFLAAGSFALLYAKHGSPEFLALLREWFG